MKKIIGLLLVACCLNSYASGDSTTIPSIPDPTPPYPKYFSLPKFSYTVVFGNGANLNNPIYSPGVVVPRNGQYDIMLYTLSWSNDQHPAGYFPFVRLRLIRNIAKAFDQIGIAPYDTGTVMALNAYNAGSNSGGYSGGWYNYYLTVPGWNIWGYAGVYRADLNMNDTITAVIAEGSTDPTKPDVLIWAKLTVEESP